MATNNTTSILLTADDRTRAAFDSARRGLQGLESAGNKVNAVLSTLGIGAIAGGGLAAFVKASINAADNINDLSQKIGVNVETLAGYKLAAEQSGTSLEGMGNAAKKLNQSLANNNPVLEKLGIVATDANGALLQLADIFSSMPDGAQKTAIAMNLMGKSGADMIPLLNGGSAALEAMLKDGKELYPVTTSMAKAADQFNDSMARFKIQAEGVGITMANSLLPGMNDMLARWGDAISLSQKHGGFIGLVMGGINPTGKNSENLKNVRQEISAIQLQLKDAGTPQGTIAGIDGPRLRARLAELEAIKKTLLEIQQNEALRANDKYGTADYKQAKTPAKALPANLFGTDSASKNAANKAAQAAAKLAAETMKVEFDAAMDLENYRVEQETKALINQREALRQIAETGFAGDSQTMAMIEAQTDTLNQFYSELASGSDVLQQYEAAAAQLASTRTRLDAEVNIGTKSQTAAQIELRAATGRLGDELAGNLIPRLNQLIETAPDEATREKWRALYAEITSMQATGGQSGPFAGLQAGLKEYANATVDTFGTVKSAVGSAFKGMEDALTSFVMTGKLNFKDMTNSIIADMVRMVIQQKVTQPLAMLAMNFLGNASTAATYGTNIGSQQTAMLASQGFAKGGMPGGTSAWRNQIVSQPTLFAFAKGGIMGEAGPEAIMPLKRGPDGTLGVRGGGSNVQVNIINNASGAQASSRERSDNNGNRIIDVLIEQVKGAIAGDITRGSGPVSGALASTYGLNRVAGSY